jgi:hypothetical protein
LLFLKKENLASVPLWMMLTLEMQIAKRTESKIGSRGKFGEDTQLVALKSTLRKAAEGNLKCYSPALSELLTTHLTIEIPCPEAEFIDTL